MMRPGIGCSLTCEHRGGAVESNDFITDVALQLPRHVDRVRSRCFGSLA
jgi:hypothetical protein